MFWSMITRLAILLFVLIRGLFWRRYRRHHHGWHPGWGHGEHDPRNILAQRYARGEISEQEYRERLAVLTTQVATPPRK